MLSEGDKMFEKAGYSKPVIEESYTTKTVYKNNREETKISFSNDYKNVLKTQGIYPKAISMEELQAIHKKCEEWGWINE